MLPLSLALVLIAAAPSPKWGEVNARLEQIESEYVELMEGLTPEGLAQEQTHARELLALAHELTPRDEALLQHLTRLNEGIARGELPQQLLPAFKRGLAILKSSGRLMLAPRGQPSAALGARVYARACAACHGAAGGADTPAARALTPHPVSFLDSDVVNPLSPFRVFNVVTWGEADSAMPAFPTLTDEERWAVSFYVFSLRHPSCRVKSPKVTMLELAQSTDNEVVAKYGEPALACLRRR